MKNLLTLALIIASLFIPACAPEQPSAVVDAGTVPKTLTVYSARHYDSDRALYAAYESQTGIRIDVREAKADQLLETMKAEGQNSPADLIIAADAGALWRFQDAGLTQPFSDPQVNAKVPANLRQSEGHWIGLGKRVRMVAYDPLRYDQSDVDEWFDLIAPDKRGEICVRSSSNIYNLSLMAEMIERTGAQRASEWAKGIVANMARKPQGGDTDQIRVVAAGQCSIAIVNHYYWVRLATSSSSADRKAAEATKIAIPGFPDGLGVHVNITGAAIAATADDTGMAGDFIAFLLSPEGQALLTVETRELPIVAGLALPEGVEALPAFVASQTPLDVFGENQAEAQRLYDLAGWD